MRAPGGNEALAQKEEDLRRRIAEVDDLRRQVDAACDAAKGDAYAAAESAIKVLRARSGGSVERILALERECRRLTEWSA